MSSEGLLDSAERRAQIDRGNMSHALMSFPFHLEKGWELAKNLDVGAIRRQPSSILISGMGGSAIGGDIFGDVIRHFGSTVVSVNRSYSLPPVQAEGSLHIAVSYSGNTEETLTSFTRGVEKGLQSVGIASGGKLEALCADKGVPFLKIPQGEKPRAALGYMLSSLLGIATKLGVYDFSSLVMDAVQTARTTVASVAPGIPFKDNMSKQIAAWIGGSVPIIIGSTEVYSVIERMKTQFNENSKRFAWIMTMPEANHNDWIPLFLDKSASAYKAIILDSVADEPLLKRRMKVVNDMLSTRMETRRIEASGGSYLDKLLSYIVLGDNASYYLAILDGNDPSPVEPIEALKRELAKTA